MKKNIGEVSYLKHQVLFAVFRPEDVAPDFSEGVVWNSAEVFYLFSITPTGSYFNWTIWGVIFLTGLFLLPGASLDITEALSSNKYPEYVNYQHLNLKWFNYSHISCITLIEYAWYRLYTVYNTCMQFVYTDIYSLYISVCNRL